MVLLIISSIMLCLIIIPFHFSLVILELIAIFSVASKSLGAGKAASHDVTLISNYSNIIPFADSVWTKARQMYEQKAYLHWYYKHGLSQVNNMFIVLDFFHFSKLI